MMTNPIADMLTRIRNAVRVERATVELPSSKVKRGVADVLKREGYMVGANGVLHGGVVDDSSVLLEVNDGKKHLEKIPMTEGQPMFIADVIRDAQLHKKIGRIQVRVMRPNGNSAPVRMDIDFDDTGRRVREGTNYSLRAGDRIVVTKDDSTAVSRMLSKSSLSDLLR